MRTALTLLLAATLLFAADLESLRERLASHDAPDRVAALKGLAGVEGEEASKLIAGALRDRDAEVRSAAVKALGGRRDEVALKALRACLKQFAKDPELLPTVVYSLGYSADVASAGAIADLLRRGLGADPVLARAAIDALGKIRAKPSVAALMEALGVTSDPRGTPHPEYLRDVLDSLVEVTGLPFRNAATWQTWWQNARRNYKGAPAKPVPTGTEYRNDGWRFSIERPKGDRWVFESVAGAVIRIRFTGPREEAVFAWIDVSVRSALEPEKTTREAVAKEYRRYMTKQLGDVNDASWGEPGHLGRAPALCHSATGVRRGGVVFWRAYFVEKNDLIFTVAAYLETGASAAVRKEADSILASFTLLDG